MAAIADPALTVGFRFTVIATIFDVAGLPEIQVAFDVKTQVTKSLFDGT